MDKQIKAIFVNMIIDTLYLERRLSGEDIQHICFRYIDSRIPLPHKLKMPNLKPFGLRPLFVSHLVGNPKDRFSRDAA